MADVVIRPLVAGEESVFESMPDPLPQLRRVGYADGIAGGGFAPERTWVATRDGRVVARAAWLRPPGAAGTPWLEQFDVDGEPETGARLLRAAFAAMGGATVYYATAPAYWRRQPEVRTAVEAPMTAARLAGLVERGERVRCSWTGGPVAAASGRWRFRAAAGVDEVNALVARIADPDVLTGREIALSVGGVDLARDPLAWVTGQWRVALGADGEPVGLAGATADACYPMLAYLGVLDPAARAELLADAVQTLAGAYEVLADADAHRTDVVADLERTGFRRIRSRTSFEPARALAGDSVAPPP